MTTAFRQPVAARPITATPTAATPFTGTPALALQGISLAFGGIQALKDVSFDVQRGEIRAVIGPNGAGKSSLMNVISGLYRADAGRVTLAGQSFAHVPAQRLARLGVGRTFQNLALFSGLSVGRNIAAGLAFRQRAGLVGQVLGLPGARREQAAQNDRIHQTAEFLGLTHLLDHPVATLPYGLQKHVDLARALVAGPKLLLLDEPMAGLTATEKAALTRQIRTLRDRFGIAIVLIEHDIGVVMELSDRIAVLDHGALIADGRPSFIRQHPDVIRAYLGADPELAA